MIYSTHGTWSTCRNGVGETKHYAYLPNNYYIDIHTSLIVTYFIYRGWLYFDTSELDPGAVVTGAKLGLWVISHLSEPDVPLYITKGLQGDPVLLSDWVVQTGEVTVCGEKLFSALVNGQYNEIDLNAAGIALINAAGAIHQQFESYDCEENADFNTYGINWWCESFTPAVAHKKNSVKFKMWRSGLPGNITVEIKAADGSHFPTGPVLCSGTFDGNTLTTSSPGEWYEISLGAGANLSEGVEYTVELKATGGTAAKLVKLRGDSSGFYLGGQAAYTLNSGGSWTAQPAHDIYFIEYDTTLASTKGTKLCLRTAYDVNDSAPGSGLEVDVKFHSAQKGVLYAPKLTIDYHL